MKQFLLAFQFLTIFPIKLKGKVSACDLGASMRYFPVVGILIGIMLSCLGFLGFVLPRPIVSVLIVLALVIVTGGIHVDGLADTCDGFYGLRGKEDRLRIMKDSCVGAMGVIGIVISVLLRYVLIAEISFNDLGNILILMVVCGRWAQVFACYICSYARDKGTAEHFVSQVGRTEIIFATIITLVTAWTLLNAVGIFLFCVQALCAYFFVQFSKFKIKGITGDTIGALNEITEICVLLSAQLYMGIMHGL